MRMAEPEGQCALKPSVVWKISDGSAISRRVTGYSSDVCM